MQQARHYLPQLTGVLTAVSFAVVLVVIAGAVPTTFAGPAVLRTYLYVPLVAGHAVVALLTFPAVYYALLVGMTNPPGVLPATRHARAGRVAAALWLLTFASGLVIYVMLHFLW